MICTIVICELSSGGGFSIGSLGGFKGKAIGDTKELKGSGKFWSNLFHLATLYCHVMVVFGKEGVKRRREVQSIPYSYTLL